MLEFYFLFPIVVKNYWAMNWIFKTEARESNCLVRLNLKSLTSVMNSIFNWTIFSAFFWFCNHSLRIIENKQTNSAVILFTDIENADSMNARWF